MIENGREFAAVQRDVWARMLEIARSERIENGGMFDPRSAAINVWATSQDRPKGQDFPIIGGEHECAYHSGLYAEFETHFSVRLTLVVSNYEHGDHTEKTCGFEGRARAVAKEAAIRGYDADWKWARDKFNALMKRAE